MKTVLTVVGTRPQLIKSAALSARLRERFREVVVHTGQHYDHALSGLFFEEFALPAANVELGVGSLDHAAQTAEMAQGIERVSRETSPDAVLVFGDTNSTLAGALAAARTGLPLVHVEAGTRSGELSMPEEVNRIAADHLADLLLCPTATTVANLAAEGLSERARLVGDLMLDACLAARDRLGDEAAERHGVRPGEYLLATVHRAENTERPGRLTAILEGFSRVGETVLLPAHPRTRKALAASAAGLPANLRLVDPVGYLDMLSLVSRARRVLTDSGGLQKEAYFLGVPCVTLRETTEWPETVAAGRNRLVGSSPAAIREAASEWRPDDAGGDLSLFGDGRASDRIVASLFDAYG